MLSITMTAEDPFDEHVHTQCSVFPKKEYNMPQVDCNSKSCSIEYALYTHVHVHAQAADVKKTMMAQDEFEHFLGILQSTEMYMYSSPPCIINPRHACAGGLRYLSCSQ